MTTEAETYPTATVKKLSIKIIGLGGAGVKAIDYMAKTELSELQFLGIHTSERELVGSTASHKLLLGLKMMRGLGTGGDPDLGKAAAEEDAIKLKESCAGDDLVFIVAGLGGGKPTGAAPVLARVAKESGALVLAIVTLPFDFEGTRRQRQAQLGLQQLKAAADGVICVPHQKIVKLIDEKTSLVETFNITNEMLTQGVRGIWQMLTRQGLINVDFTHLCSVLRGRHAESSFATASAQGEGRAREVIEKLLASPLLEGGMLTDADALLVSLLGGTDLTMSDVNRVMEQINRQAEHADVIVGASIAEEFAGRLSVTLVASRRSQPGIEPSQNVGEEGASDRSHHESSGVGFVSHFFDASASERPASRFVPPPPELTPERTRQLLAKQNGSGGRSRKSGLRWSQGQLPLEIVSKGRFEKSEPTIHQGEDLDVPTYIRRGIALN